MPDKFSKEARSKIMSKIKSTTKLEIYFRKELYKQGLKGYRINYKLPGKPDIVYPKQKLAVFIDGDFWHGFNWKVKGKIPPKGYWQKKIQKNIDRDKKIVAELESKGWKVIRLWEHEVNKDLQACIDKVKSLLELT